MPPAGIKHLGTVRKYLPFWNEKLLMPDGISADLLRAGGSALCSLLAKHFNHYIRLGRIPDSWKEPKTVLIFKKGKQEDLNWDDKGYLVDGKQISNLCFADDIVLISTSTAEVEEMLNELNVAGIKIRLGMNMSKTQFIVNQECDAGLVRLNGVALQQVGSYVYLGKELNMDNDLASEIVRRSRAARAVFSSIREVTSQVKDARASIFNASVLPAMCYATETWPDNKTIARAMQTTHRALERCLLRKSLRQQWQEGLRSSELRAKSQLADSLQYMKKSKYRWNGHLLRRKDDRWSLRVIEWLPRDHRRPLGRPPTRWADSFSRSFRERCLPHWLRAARVRASGRVVVPAEKTSSRQKDHQSIK